MYSLARRKQATLPPTTQEIGRVVHVEGDAEGLVVRTTEADLRAVRATSCLVAPQKDDEVLVVLSPDGRAFVLAVLTRESTDVEVNVAGALRVEAREVHLGGQRGTMRFGHLTLLAKAILAHGDDAKVALRNVDGIFDRVTQTVKNCFRTVEEVDHLRAERVDYRAEEEMTLRAESIMAGARELVKLDGEQIHLG